MALNENSPKFAEKYPEPWSTNKFNTSMEVAW